MLIETDNLVTLDKAAKMLDMYYTKLRYYVLLGEGPKAIKICGREYYFKDSVKKWKIPERRERT